MEIAGGYYHPEDFPSETENMAQHSLYEKLIRHPELIGFNAVLQLFYDNYLNTAIQRQTEIMLDMDNLSIQHM